MKYLGLLLVVLISIFSQPSSAQKKSNQKQIIGYYPGWQVYDRNKLAAPENIDLKKYSTIIYAFFLPDYYGNLKPADAFIDNLVLKGKRDWRYTDSEQYYPNTSIVELAKSKKVDVLISIGGWTGSTHFSAISSDSTKRKHFANECIRLINEYKVDGIDIDWEFPGKDDPADGENFSLLLKDIRDAMKKKELLFKKREKRHLQLSIAISSSDIHMQYIQWEQVLPLLDFVNVMTYDYAGSWKANNAHKSPLYAKQGEDISNTVEILKNKYHVPDSLFSIGSSFAGNALKCRKGNVELGDAHLGSYDAASFPISKGQPNYYSIIGKQDEFIDKWDSLSKATYWISNDSTTFLSFESERSITEKAKYVIDQNLRGLIIWDITGDIIETKKGSGIIKKTPLVDAAYREFKK